MNRQESAHLRETQQLRARKAGLAPLTNALHLKALVFLYAFEESVDCHLLSSFCDDSNLRISLFKYVLSTMGVSKESISKLLIGNRFHVKLRILSPENCKQSLRVKVERLK